MPNKSRKQKRKSQRPRRARGSNSANPPATALRYVGPLRSKFTSPPVVVDLVSITELKTTSSSFNFTQASVFQVSDVTSLQGWSAWSSNYQEARVLAISTHYVPKFQAGINFPTLNAPDNGIAQASFVSPIFMGAFDEDNTAFTSPVNTVNHQGIKFTSPNMPLMCGWRLHDVDEADFSKTASFSATAAGVKTYLTGVSNLTSAVLDWGSYITFYRIQFRTYVGVGNQSSIQSSSQSNVMKVCPDKGAKLSVESKQKSENRPLTKDQKEDLEEYFVLERAGTNLTSVRQLPYATIPMQRCVSGVPLTGLQTPSSASSKLS